MEKKAVNIRVNKQNWEELQLLAKELGHPKHWLSGQLDIVVEGLLVVAKHVKKDLEDQKQMTKAQAMQRYEEMMRQHLEGKLED